MRIRHAAAAGVLLWLLSAVGARAQDALALAPTAASELLALCGTDDGQLWGERLCAPLLVADPASRQVWASAADSQGVLARSGAGWRGALPTGVALANTSVEWAGVHWAMVLGPLPANATERRVLLAHEAWHAHQDALGLRAYDAACAHLETAEGRTLMRLEMRALAVAMRSTRRGRERALSDALAFRASRLTQFDAAADERALELNEGLAAYTGVKLGAGDGAAMFAAHTLDTAERSNALARTFAYATGPAYGLLLDDRRPGWRIEVKAGRFSPADLLAAQTRAAPLPGDRLAAAEARYGGAALRSEELARAERQAAQVAGYRSRFAEAPRLEIPGGQMQMEFDPYTVTPVEGLGTYYGTLTVRGTWGEAAASQGALISADGATVVLESPAADGLTGPGWRLSLTPGYGLSARDAAGVLQVVLLSPAAPQE